MSVTRSAVTLARGAAWLVTKSAATGSKLVEVAGSDDEDASTIAKMMLVRGGGAAVPLVEAAVLDGKTDLVDLLVSIGDLRAEASLDRLAQTGDGAVAIAARAGADELRRIREHGDR